MTSSSRRRMSCGRKLKGRSRNAKHCVARSSTNTLVSPSFDLAVAEPMRPRVVIGALIGIATLMFLPKELPGGGA